MSKCSRCETDFVPLKKSNWLPYKHCDRCRGTDQTYRNTHIHIKEQINFIEINADNQAEIKKDQYYLDQSDKIKQISRSQ